MRFSGKSRLGFYPLPISEAQGIRRFLSFPEVAAAIDPCVGDGVAFEAITSGAEVLRYDIELDAYRAEQAKERIPNTIQGNALEVHCPVETFGCVFCNPPYDWSLETTESRRAEQPMCLLPPRQAERPDFRFPKWPLLLRPADDSVCVKER